MSLNTFIHNYFFLYKNYFLFFFIKTNNPQSFNFLINPKFYIILLNNYKLNETVFFKNKTLLKQKDNHSTSNTLKLFNYFYKLYLNNLLLTNTNKLINNTNNFNIKTVNFFKTLLYKKNTKNQHILKSTKKNIIKKNKIKLKKIKLNNKIIKQLKGKNYMTLIYKLNINKFYLHKNRARYKLYLKNLFKFYIFKNNFKNWNLFLKIKTKQKKHRIKLNNRIYYFLNKRIKVLMSMASRVLRVEWRYRTQKPFFKNYNKITKLIKTKKQTKLIKSKKFTKFCKKYKKKLNIIFRRWLPFNKHKSSTRFAKKKNLKNLKKLKKILPQLKPLLFNYKQRRLMLKNLKYRLNGGFRKNKKSIIYYKHTTKINKVYTKIKLKYLNFKWTNKVKLYWINKLKIRKCTITKQLRKFLKYTTHLYLTQSHNMLLHTRFKKPRKLFFKTKITDILVENKPVVDRVYPIKKWYKYKKKFKKKRKIPPFSRFKRWFWRKKLKRKNRNKVHAMMFQNLSLNNIDLNINRKINDFLKIALRFFKYQKKRRRLKRTTNRRLTWFASKKFDEKAKKYKFKKHKLKTIVPRVRFTWLYVDYFKKSRVVAKYFKVYWRKNFIKTLTKSGTRFSFVIKKLVLNFYLTNKLKQMFHRSINSQSKIINILNTQKQIQLILLMAGFLNKKKKLLKKTYRIKNQINKFSPIKQIIKLRKKTKTQTRVSIIKLKKRNLINDKFVTNIIYRIYKFRLNNLSFYLNKEFQGSRALKRITKIKQHYSKFLIYYRKKFRRKYEKKLTKYIILKLKRFINKNYIIDTQYTKLKFIFKKIKFKIFLKQNKKLKYFNLKKQHTRVKNNSINYNYKLMFKSLLTKTQFQLKSNYNRNHKFNFNSTFFIPKLWYFMFLTSFNILIRKYDLSVLRRELAVYTTTDYRYRYFNIHLKPAFYFMFENFYDNWFVKYIHAYQKNSFKNFLNYHKFKENKSINLFNNKKKINYTLNYQKYSKPWYTKINKCIFKHQYAKTLRFQRAKVNTYFDLNFKYQHKMTTFLWNFKHISGVNIFRHYFCLLYNLLFKTKFINTVNDGKFLIKNNLLFLNGFNIKNLNMPIFAGDVIALSVSWTFLKYLKINTKSKNLWKQRFRLNNIVHNVILKEDLNKQYLYKWHRFFKYKKTDVPYFLETDFTTLTSIMLLEPSYNYLFKYNCWSYNEMYWYSLFQLNWKYIV